MRAV
jgi:hypothetical protein